MFENYVQMKSVQKNHMFKLILFQKLCNYYFDIIDINISIIYNILIVTYSDYYTVNQGKTVKRVFNNNIV
jgi:hypothetical protein